MYTIKLSDEELIIINNLLINGVFKDVAPIISNINRQLHEQTKDKKG